MQKPTNKEGYTQTDLVQYARLRARAQLQEMTEIMAAQRQGQVETIEEHEEHRDPLEIAVHRQITVRLSWGGDGDGFKITVDQDNVPIKGVYFWEDWGVYEEVALSNDELEQVFDYYYLEGVAEQSTV